MFLLLITLAYATTKEKKEEACFLLSSYLVRERQGETSRHLKIHSHLKEPELRFKMIELGYNNCMGSISEDEVRIINSGNKRSYTSYIHLVAHPIEHLVSGKDLELTPEFIKVRQIVGKRLSSTKTVRTDL